MKKMKLLKPIMVASAAATPIPMLITACSKLDYSELAAELKDSQIEIFQQMSKIPHATWLCGHISWEHENETKSNEGIVAFIEEFLKDHAGLYPEGSDNWSQIKTVNDAIKNEWSNRFISPESQVYGNMWFDIPATPGYEDAPKIILQAHMDMTIAFKGSTEEERDISIQTWQNNGVKAEYDLDAETIRTDGLTSLGSDDGMGVALLLAIAKLCHNTPNAFKHGVIRLLFTADESGATDALLDNTGKEIIPAFAASADLLAKENADYDLKYKTNKDGEQPIGMLNPNNRNVKVGPFDYFPEGAEECEKYAFTNVISLDSVTKGEIYQSAAGIHECVLSVDLMGEEPKGYETIPNDKWKWHYPDDTEENDGLYLYTLTVSGLMGGHSAIDMDSNHANALQILTQMMTFNDNEIGTETKGQGGFRLVSLTSGDSAYQICNEAKATFVTKFSDETIQKRVEQWKKVYKAAFPYEDDLNIDCKQEITPDGNIKTLGNLQTLEIIVFSNLMKFGPQTWFDDQYKEIETSCNFGPLTIEQVEGGIKIAYHVVTRSASEGILDMFTESIHAYSELIFDVLPLSDGIIQHISDPVWEKKDDNKLLNLVDQSYSDYGYAHKRVNCHGWAEISCFVDQFKKEGKDLNMAIIGPTILSSHTLGETLWTDTLDSVIKVVLNTCHNIKQVA